MKQVSVHRTEKHLIWLKYTLITNNLENKKVQ